VGGCVPLRQVTSPCGWLPQGAGCRVQPCSPAPSSLRPVREHQGLWGAQLLQTCGWTGEPRGPDALATFHWAGTSLSLSPAEQQDRPKAVCRGEARARRDPPQDSGGCWQSKACPGHFCEEALIPGARPSPCVPTTPGGPRAAGPQQGREALVSVPPCPAACATPSPTVCPHPRHPGARLRVVRFDGVGQLHGPVWAQPAAPPHQALK